ncbi:MAG: hypothetical protein EPO36_11005 [Chloroflexota bacterium]|nr:MAG: hypothetical protein EPO36_11005 [Chloroflexota bacterium]
MSSVVRDLVDAAKGGRPVYISTVRERLEGLDPAASFRVTATLQGFDARVRAFSFALPKFASLAFDERAMIIEYVLASLYNIISTVGGRGLTLETSDDDGDGVELAAIFEQEFGIGLARLDRPGYGRAINVAERMDEAVSPEGTPDRGMFRLARRMPSESREMPVSRAGPGGSIAELCDRSRQGLVGAAICGIDVGGTDIKLCLAVDGQVASFLEYDWFPAAFTAVDQIIDPIVLLVRLLRLDGACARGLPNTAAVAEVLQPAFGRGASLAVIEAAVRAGEALLAEPFALDAIGVCFPDVVVRDKIVGGEVYKTRGMRDHLGAAYEGEFRRLSSLSEELRTFVRPGGVVGIVNDGPMAAFTATVELGAAAPASIKDGVFAHTLGTELGSGWVTEDGEIPEIPLEIYNCILDLGSYPERAFAPDDVRSVNNFNTRLAGTLQKYTSQSGVFRLAAKYLPEQDPALYAELLDRGLLEGSPSGLFVPTEPRDMRKPLLELLMAAAEAGGHPAVDRIFREVGEFMAVAWLESKWLLDPAVAQRILFGRLVKRRVCFDLMVEGARSIAPSLVLEVADDEMANTDLMRQLRDSDRYTVAQFAQAIGAIHYANYRRNAASVAAPMTSGAS